MITKTLVIGSKGFIGRSFLREYRKKHHGVIGTHRSPVDGLYILDLSNPKIDTLPITKGEYSYALVTAAACNIKECELNKDGTFSINVTGSIELAQQLLDRGIVPIFFSTDYVFDGKKGGYTETSKAHSLNEYGRQKALLQEKLQQACGENFLLIRPSKVYGLEKGDKTLLDEMAQSFIQEKKVRAAYDQIFCPILIDDLVRAVMHLQEKNCRGIYNIAGSDVISRFEIAKALAREMNVDESLVEMISLNDLKEPFLRPTNTSLNCDKFLQFSKMTMQPLSKSICRVASNYRDCLCS